LTALDGESDCGGLTVYNYLSAEHITDVNAGCPMMLRATESSLTLANFMRAQIYSAFASLSIGQEILFGKESVRVNKYLAHGGIFKTAGVAQRFLAAAMNTPVTVNAAANEGGPWGMAVLAGYMRQMTNDKSHITNLESYLNKVFEGAECETAVPDVADVSGFERFMNRYRKGLEVVRKAVEVM